MPRNKASARERPPHPGEPRVFGAEAPEWARMEGYQVRVSMGEKAYRCPGCDHEVRPGTQHLVVIPGGDRDERRHWHTGCWKLEARRLSG